MRNPIIFLFVILLSPQLGTFAQSNSAASPELIRQACSGRNGRTHTRRTWIDGKRAVVQQCSATDERKGFRYIYYVTFPKVKVFDREKFRYGMFNFTVEYMHPRYSTLAKRIVRSLDFES
jgi:hypothetical protein